MSEYPTLKNPPAVEAVLDVQGAFPKEVSLEALANLTETFKERYPKRNEERLLQFGFQHQAGSEPKAMAQDHGVRGYRFQSEDDKEIVQCRKDGFTFNRLKPYTEWEDVYPKAGVAWDIFRKAFPEMVINRVSLRYINQIFIPLTAGKVDLETHFTVDLPGPQNNQLTRAGFMGQSVFFDPQTGFNANWIMAHQPSPDPAKMCVILDIDVFTLGPAVLEVSPPGIWEQMRDLKNKLFFSSFTPEGLKQFQ